MDIKIEDITKQDVLSEILLNLSKPRKELPCKFFYDETGSKLFEKISKLEEYYPTRTELEIMRENLGEISDAIGYDVLLIEPGSGNSLKTRMVLAATPGIRAYMPVDISSKTLHESAAQINKDFSNLEILPAVTDYTKEFILPAIADRYPRKVVYYPGSTIGNFHPVEAKKFLKKISEIIRGDGSFIVGVDLLKDRETLERAYNDKEGVTAEFNLNILNHVNRLTGSDFNPENFRHFAFFNQLHNRIEMHLVSKENQKVCVGGNTISIHKYETIHTENSYKYSIESFTRLVWDHFKVKNIWTDEDNLFAIFNLDVKE